MKQMLGFYCKGCNNYISFESHNPKDTVTEETLRSMNFTVLTEDGYRVIYCPKCKDKVPEEYKEVDEYSIKRRMAPKHPWEKNLQRRDAQ